MHAASHRWEARPKDVLRLLGGPLLAVVGFSLVMHLGAATWLPAPQPRWDIDQAVLTHQASAAAKVKGADFLFIGDSSCLMDVVPSVVREELPDRPDILNLGTLSFLDPGTLAQLLDRFARANPGRPRNVVLLMHPEALRRHSAIAYYDDLLRAQLGGPSLPTNGEARARILSWTGLAIFRDRVLSPLVPRPLPPAYGKYGFTRDLSQAMTHANGHVDAPGRYDPANAQGTADYRIGKLMRKSGAAMTEALPEGAKLLIGITPVPESFAQGDHPERVAGMLKEWARLVNADGVLDGLPPTLPDRLFASKTHLNETGARIYSRLLGRELSD